MSDTAATPSLDNGDLRALLEKIRALEENNRALAAEKEATARERAALAEAVREEGVLALGGGAVVDPVNRAMLKDWRVVVLMASARTLRARIGGADPSRPLAGQLEALLAARAAAYAAAGPIVDTEGLALEAVADRVEALCGWR